MQRRSSLRSLSTLAGVLGLVGLASPAAAQGRVAATQAMREVERVEHDGFVLQAALRSARANRDPGRAACIDDALTRVHVAARTARALADSIAAAERAGDPIAMNRDLTRLTHLGERTLEVYTGGRRCGLPEGVLGTERTTVTASAPPLPPTTGDFPRPATPPGAPR